MRLFEWERLDRRVLGALRLVDAASGLPIRRPLRIEGEGFRLLRNRSGLYVIDQVDALAEHRDAFESPPDEPALGSASIALSVRDPASQYLPRLLSVALPRDPDPDNSDQPGSLFRAIDVPMYPSPVAAVGGNWSVLRVAITQPAVAPATVGDPVPGVLVRVLRQVDGETHVLARALSDARGQTLVAVPGIPVTQFSDGNGDDGGGGPGGGGPPEDSGLASGAVVELSTPVSLEFIVDPDMDWPVNPAVVEANAPGWTRTPDEPASLDFNLRTGRGESVAVVIDMS